MCVSVCRPVLVHGHALVLEHVPCLYCVYITFIHHSACMHPVCTHSLFMHISLMQHVELTQVIYRCRCSSSKTCTVPQTCSLCNIDVGTPGVVRCGMVMQALQFSSDDVCLSYVLVVVGPHLLLCDCNLPSPFFTSEMLCLLQVRDKDCFCLNGPKGCRKGWS